VSDFRLTYFNGDTLMGKVVPFKSKQSDPWCSPLVLEDGTRISGGAAREKRLKAVGGVDSLLRLTLDAASRLASADSKKAI
jgi:hypothetical protein